MIDETTFHSGEQAVQKRLGVFDEIGPWAKKVVRPCLPDMHREFYREQPFLVAAARDAEGRPWATLLTGRPGFTTAKDSTHLSIEANPVVGDALEGHLVAGESLGLLGIELATRRRNRVNGRIERSTANGIELEVGQSFGNCPQYIREREWKFIASAGEPQPIIRSKVFGPDLRARIAAADTFFIATGHEGEGHAPSHGMDASHRGGPPGFVGIEGDRQLVFPDYAGNNHFNTIGNLAVDDRAGLLFVDFENGGMLQLTGRATIDWTSPAIAEIPGARRLVRFELEEAIDLPGVLPIRWQTSRESASSLVLVEKRRESADALSFLFAAEGAGELPDFLPGQHLPIELEIPGATDSIRRTYSLSNRPGEDLYRISVKREPLGVASRFLHDSLDVGARVEARRPAGEFVLEPGDRPIVLLSAGIGVTPMLSMLGELVATADRRHISFLHVARDSKQHAFKAEVSDLIAASSDALQSVWYTRPGPRDRVGHDFDTVGRIDAAQIRSLVPDLDAAFYVCGPVGFMAEMQEGIEAIGVASHRIHSESFGPATIQ
jgi:uncharacterized protein